jgi:hypothetical protein
VVGLVQGWFVTRLTAGFRTIPSRVVPLVMALVRTVQGHAHEQAPIVSPVGR